MYPYPWPWVSSYGEAFGSSQQCLGSPSEESIGHRKTATTDDIAVKLPPLASLYSYEKLARYRDSCLPCSPEHVPAH